MATSTARNGATNKPKAAAAASSTSTSSSSSSTTPGSNVSGIGGMSITAMSTPVPGGATPSINQIWTSLAHVNPVELLAQLDREELTLKNLKAFFTEELERVQVPYHIISYHTTTPHIVTGSHSNLFGVNMNRWKQHC
jgi:hypothetical protein